MCVWGGGGCQEVCQGCWCVRCVGVCQEVCQEVLVCVGGVCGGGMSGGMSRVLVCEVCRGMSRGVGVCEVCVWGGMSGGMSGVWEYVRRYVRSVGV